MSDPVPIKSLPQNERIQSMRKEFEAIYAEQPEWFVRVPGRVNLIGEHIDYCGYGVCPMALEQDILLAVSVKTDSILKLHNVDKQFKDFECDLKGFKISASARDEGGPQWYQYFLCGVQGIFGAFPEETKEPKGMRVLVSGTIPQSAGLSSSSALVSAAALTTSYAHQFSVSKEKLANLCAECERYIGTQGGGMDQAIAFLANEGCAKLIEFSPLRSSDIALPPGAVFVIAHSITNLNKAATADYNCRVIECRLAAQIIAKKRGLAWPDIRQLGQLQQALAVDLPEMITIVERTLHQSPYTKSEVEQELEITREHLDETSLTQNTRHIESFKLKQRALHVFQEAHRVKQFHATCVSAQGEEALVALGQLMTQSHESLRDLYECSHPQLDRLVELSGEFTFGSRLTGAGWGGCAVSLVHPHNANKYVNFLKENFYKPLGIVDNFSNVLFATSPNAGACIYN